jgi:hypothetical protein
MTRTMERRHVAWLLSLALMAVGGVLAHLLAYRLAVPDHAMRGEALAHTGHGAASGHWQLCFAVCGSIALVGILASLVDRLRGGGPLRVPLWVFALVPPVGFAVQEHLERLLSGGALAHLTAIEPVFLIGIVLQLPFALLAYVTARALLALAAAFVETLRARRRAALVSHDLVLARPPDRRTPRASVLARGYGQRAPPLAAA